MELFDITCHGGLTLRGHAAFVHQGTRQGSWFQAPGCGCEVRRMSPRSGFSRGAECDKILISYPRESGGEGKAKAALRRPGIPQHRGRREERVELREGSEGLLPGRPGGRRLLHPRGQGQGLRCIRAGEGGGRSPPRERRLLWRELPERTSSAHGDDRDDDGMRHHAARKSGHRARAPRRAKVLSYLLSRNSRVEEDLVDQLFNSSEKRLARVLLLMANFGKEGKPEPVIAKISQETLAEMVGTTRSRVSHFMNKFRKLGFIEYNGTLEVHNSLLNMVLHDNPHLRRRAENDE